MRRVAVIFALAAGLLASPVTAQDRAQTLADIRQELTVLYVEIQRLKGELNTTGAAQGVATPGSALDRVNGLEAAVTRLTAKTEELEFRINRIVKDGTNRIGDLEFRLVELEGGDIAALGDTPSLGGGDLPAAPTAPVASDGGTDFGQLAVGEQADFDAGMVAMAEGDFARAASLFAGFAQTYPGSPLTGDVEFMRGEALSKQGMTTEAARAFLSAYTLAPQGARAPEALFRLGAALGELGQKSEACATLSEVLKRFPSAAAASRAREAMAGFACNR
ncbi:MAG: tol-pal system protein YbgF [Rhodobacterales bacterium]|nr:MAG: tol-pal system protein YbgF [Rhodobacterales bacterium]